MASGVVASLPVVVLFLMFQRYVVTGDDGRGHERLNGAEKRPTKGRKDMRHLVLGTALAAMAATGATAQEVTLGRFFGACEDAGTDTTTSVGEPCIIQSIINAADAELDGGSPSPPCRPTGATTTTRSSPPMPRAIRPTCT